MSTAYFDRRSRLLVIDCLNLEGYPLRYSCAPYLRRGDGSHIESLELQPGNDPHQEVHLLCQRTKAQGVLLLNMLQRFGLQRSRTILHDLRTVMGREMPVFLGGTVEVLCSQLMAEPQQGGVPVLDRLEGLAGTEGMSSIPRLCLAGNDETDGLDMKEFALVLESLACNSEIDVLLPGAAASGASQWGSGWSLTVQPDDSAGDVIRERIRCLTCDRIALTGDMTEASPWPDRDGFTRWLESIHERNPSMTISMRGDLPWFDDDCLQAIRRCGVQQCDIQVSPQRLLDPLQSSGIRRQVRMCLDHQISPRISGETLTPGASWPEMRRIWAICEGIGLDFIGVLASVADSGAQGWCANVCSILSRDSSVFFEYELAYRHVQLARRGMSWHKGRHPSVSNLCGARFGQVRNILAGEISDYGVLRHGRDRIEQAAQDAIAELEGIITTLRRSATNPAGARSGLGSASEDRVAIVIPVDNNEFFLRLCLASIHKYTHKRHDLFIVDHGDLVSNGEELPARGRMNYARLPRQRLNSFAVALGLTRAWEYDYMLVLSPQTCIIGKNWLEELIKELEVSPRIGAVGVRSERLDYSQADNRTVAYLRRYVLNSPWRTELGCDPELSDAELLSQLTVEGTDCFVELEDWVQLYRGDVLRRIGLPIVNDAILRHYHWAAELSMRVVACGYLLKDSSTVEKKVKHFGEASFSLIPGLSHSQEFVESVRQWLLTNKNDDLAETLVADPYKNLVRSLSLYDW